MARTVGMFQDYPKCQGRYGHTQRTSMKPCLKDTTSQWSTYNPILYKAYYFRCPPCGDELQRLIKRKDWGMS